MSRQSDVHLCPGECFHSTAFVSGKPRKRWMLGVQCEELFGTEDEALTGSS